MASSINGVLKTRALLPLLFGVGIGAADFWKLLHSFQGTFSQLGNCTDKPDMDLQLTVRSLLPLFLITLRRHQHFLRAHLRVKCLAVFTVPGFFQPALLKCQCSCSRITLQCYANQHAPWLHSIKAFLSKNSACIDSNSSLGGFQLSPRPNDMCGSCDECALKFKI